MAAWEVAVSAVAASAAAVQVAAARAAVVKVEAAMAVVSEVEATAEASMAAVAVEAEVAALWVGCAPPSPSRAGAT